MAKLLRRLSIADRTAVIKAMQVLRSIFTEDDIMTVLETKKCGLRPKGAKLAVERFPE